MITSGSVVIPRDVACWMFAATYTAEAPIGRFQILSRENGQRRGVRPPGGPPPGGGFVVTVTAIEKSGTGGPPAPKNSSGDGAFTSPCPRLPPPHTSSRSFASE